MDIGVSGLSLHKGPRSLRHPVPWLVILVTPKLHYMVTELGVLQAHQTEGWFLCNSAL